jgi:hypothetical protein
VTTESRPAGPSQPIEEVNVVPGVGRFVGKEMIQDVQGRSLRASRPLDAIAADERRVLLFHNAWKSGNLAAIDEMFPGMAAAIEARSPGQMETAYIRAVGGKNPGRVRTALRKFGERSSSDVASDDPLSRANQYPMHFAMSTAMRSLNFFGRPFLMKAGGVSQAGEKALADRLARGEVPGLAGGGLRDRLLQAKIQKAYDLGDIVEGQELQKRLEQMRGGWNRPSSLSDLPRVAADAVNITKVGEHGPEALVDLRGGKQFVVPTHQLRAFEKMSGKQGGGFFDDLPSKVRFRGAQGRFIKPEQQTGFVRGTGEIQRVYVVNMPAGGFGGRTDEEEFRIAHGAPAQPTAATIQRQMQLTGQLGPEDRAGSATVGRQTEAGSLAKFAAREAVGDFTSRLDQVGINISEALQQSPVRALSVAMGQIAQTVIGGRAGILARAAGARAAERAAGQAVAEERGAQELISAARFGRAELREKVLAGEALTPKEEKRFDALGKTIAEQTKRIDRINPLIEEQVRHAESLAKGGITRAGLLSDEQRRQFGIPESVGENEEVRVPGILSRRQQVVSQAVGLGGIVGGTLLFTAAMHLAQEGLKYIGAAATAAGDQLTGFAFTARDQAKAWSEGFAQTPFARVVEAQQMARLGIGPGFAATGAVAQQAQILAGLQRLQEARDVRRAGQFFEGQQGGPVAGLGVGFGNGVFGTFIGQQQGAAELMASALISPTQARVGQVEWGTLLSDTVQDAFDQALGGAGTRGAEREAAMDMAEQRALRANQELADSWNRDIEKWTKFNSELSPGRFRVGTPGVLSEASLRAYRGAGFGDAQLDLFRQAGIEFTGRNGEVTSDLINQALRGVVNARLLPGIAEQLTAMEPQFRATMNAQRRQFELQQELIPTAAAEQLIARPYPVRPMTGITAREGVDPIAAAAAEKYAGALGNARDAMMEIRDQGLAELRSLGVPQEAIDDVIELGTAITKLQSKASDLQLGLEQAQYNEQIRISIRGIGDLLALNGRQAMTIGDQVVAATELGRLQRAQISDSRELANIQLARSQRELNLQGALSRLRSPGETPEERAVRRREAELLIREQQRELDITKRTTQRGFRIEDIGFGRQLTDAVKQLGLLQQARAVAIEVRGIQQIIAAKEQLLQVKQAFLTVPKEAGIAIRQAAIQIISTLEATLGELDKGMADSVDKYVRKVTETWGDRGLIDRILYGSRKEPGAAPSPGGGVMGERGSGGRAGYGTPRTGDYANLGLWNRPFVRERATPGGGSVAVGSAGGEMAFMSGVRTDMNGGPRSKRGGDINISVNVKADVRGEADEDRMARKVARMLHDEVALLVTA